MSPRDVWSDTTRDSARHLADAEHAARHDAQAAPGAHWPDDRDDVPDIEDVTFVEPVWRAGWRRQMGGRLVSASTDGILRQRCTGEVHDAEAIDEPEQVAP